MLKFFLGHLCTKVRPYNNVCNHSHREVDGVHNNVCSHSHREVDCVRNGIYNHSHRETDYITPLNEKSAEIIFRAFLV